MKIRVVHRSPGQLHIDLGRLRLPDEDADVLYYALTEQPGVHKVTVLPRTGQVIVRFDASDVRIQEDVVRFLREMDIADPELQKLVPSVSGRATSELYKEKLGTLIIKRYAKKLFLPAPIRAALILYNGAPFVFAGIKDLLHKKFSAEIVHASAILASVLTGDFPTADSIIFLTEVGELLEEWTYKKSVDDLARSLSLNISTVWKVEGEETELVNLSQVKVGDLIRVYMGNVIPLDGVVYEGEAW